MNRLSISAAILAAALLLPQAGFAAKKAQPSSGASSDGLAGTFGFAADTVGSSTGSFGFAPPNAIGFRYWATDELGIDAALAVANSSATGANNSVGVGGGVVYNLRHPNNYLYIQVLGRLSYLATTQAVGPTTVNSNTIGLFGGVGFEAFIPAWPNLSVSGGTGLEFSSSSGGGSSVTGVNTSNYGSTPVQVGIHFYF